MGNVFLTRNVTTISGAVGFRLPTEAEWTDEIATWSTQNAAGAFGSVLKLPLAGSRGNSGIVGVGISGFYYSSTTSGLNSILLIFNPFPLSTIDGFRAAGRSVCLIKDDPYTGDAIDFVPEEIIIDSLPYNTVLNPDTDRIWLDRNLGASQVATSSTDADAYGDLYQWGRDTDGHEKRDSGTTETLSSTDTPGHGDFILAPDSPNDWRDPQNDLLWQGVSGTNNPGLDATTQTTVKKYLTRNGKFLKRFVPPVIATVFFNTSDTTETITAGGNLLLTINLNETATESINTVITSDLQGEVFNGAISFVNGVGTVTLSTVTKAGSVILSVTLNNGTVERGGLTVNAGDFTQLLIGEQPTLVEGNNDGNPALINSPAFKIVIADEFENQSFTYNGFPVSAFGQGVGVQILTFPSGSESATLTNTGQLVQSPGEATFNTLTIDTEGNGYVLRFTETLENKYIDSEPFNVTNITP